ncbi:MAG: cytochrome P450 [Rhodobacteraceae bacterium]|nr:cytochrome P450 [Paracoccaceae bacterium]
MSSADFKPPMPPTVDRKPVFLRLLTGINKSYIANFIETSYAMKMGHYWVPGRNIYMPNLPELAQKILVAEAEHYPKSDLLSNMLKMLLGNGVFVSNGDEWKQQRRLIDPAFVLARLERVFPLMSEACDQMFARLAELPDGTEISVDEEMTHVTADVIFRTMFSTGLSQSGAAKLFDAFARFQKSAFIAGFLDSTWLPAIFGAGEKRKAKKSGQEIRQLIEPFVRERFDKTQRGEKLETDDILSYLVEAVDPKTNARFSFEELVDQTAFLFLAGHETSASALSWSLYLLAMRQDVQDRVNNEVRAVTGEHPIKFGDIRTLGFTRSVFREALRLYPPVGFLPRQATRTEEIRGKKIKPRDMMLICPWLIHRHRLVWDKPDVFDPDRFETENCKHAIKNHAYMPFSMGPRICTGAGFATQEAILLLASLVRTYRFEPVEGHVPKPVGRLTIRSENGIRLKLTRR